MLSSDPLVDSSCSCVSSTVGLFTVRLLYVLCLPTFAKWPFFQHLLQFASVDGHLCIGDHFGALQNLHGRFPKVLFFGFAPNFSIRCIGSSFIIYFSFVENNDSGIVFFFLCVYFVSIFHSFSLIPVFFSPNFIPYILPINTVIYLEIKNSSAEMVLKLQSFSISIIRLQTFSGVSSSDCFGR